MALTATILGGALIGSEFLMIGCTDNRKAVGAFSDSGIALLNEIGETILPTTERSPGAGFANIGDYIRIMVNDCYGEKNKEIFLAGFEAFNQRVEKVHSIGFLALDRDQRREFLTELDREAVGFPDQTINQFFRMAKELTIKGYFRSEVGLTKALRYNPIPGTYRGCVPYSQGEGAMN